MSDNLLDNNYTGEFPIASRLHRLGGFILDSVLSVFTLGLGWTIWSLFAWTSGQTPAKMILKMRVVNMADNKPATWGQMAIRQFLIPLAYAIIPTIIIIIGLTVSFSSAVISEANGSTTSTSVVASGSGILVVIGYLLLFLTYLIDALWIFKGERNQRLVDVFAKTVEVNIAA
jgi:uncharacterized RDD family membrane protein YckC